MGDWKRRSNNRDWDRRFVRTTIITATRDRPDFLAHAIASVEAQTDSNWEHLVYDDGSSDPRVVEVLRAARARNPGKFFFTSPGFKGPDRPAMYWNILIGLARGRYITILDDDNAKHPEFLAKMIAPMEADPNVDAVSCGWVYVGEDGAPVPDRPVCHWNTLTNPVKLWQSNTIDSNALVFRKSITEKIGLFATDLAVCEDWHFVIRLSQQCRMVHLDDALLDYREHSRARSHRAVAMGAHATWQRIRAELYPKGPPQGALVGARGL